MKTFFLVISLALFVAVQALSVEQRGKPRGYDQKCIKDTGVDKELVKKTREGDWTSEDAKLKSFSFCMLKKSGLMTDDGKFHKDVVLAKTAPEKREKTGKAIDKCIGNTGAMKNAAKDATKDATKDAAKVSIKDATNNANKESSKFAIQDATRVPIKDATKDAFPGAIKEDVTHVSIKDATKNASPGAIKKDATHVSIKEATTVATHVSIRDATKEATNVGAKDATNDQNAWNYSKCYHAENPDQMLF